MSFEEAALLEPLATAHHACQKGGVTAGSSVLICGAGSRGIMAMQCAKNFGATSVTITGKQITSILLQILLRYIR